MTASSRILLPALTYQLDQFLGGRSNGQIETTTARKEGLEAAHARIEMAAEEMDCIDDNAALIRQSWEQGNYQAIRMLLQSIIQEVDIRVDGIVIKVYALPGGSVYELVGMAAPTGLEPVFPP